MLNERNKCHQLMHILLWSIQEYTSNLQCEDRLKPFVYIYECQIPVVQYLLTYLPFEGFMSIFVMTQKDVMKYVVTPADKDSYKTVPYDCLIIKTGINVATFFGIKCQTIESVLEYFGIILSIPLFQKCPSYPNSGTKYSASAYSTRGLD